MARPTSVSIHAFTSHQIEDKGILTYQKLSSIIENNNISIKPNPQITLRFLKPDLLGRVLTTPPHNLFDAEVCIALCAFGPENREAETDA
jgi:hypothetical protein